MSRAVDEAALDPLREASDALDDAGTVLGQLGALFAAMEEGKGPRLPELIALGHYMADTWSGTTHHVHLKTEAALRQIVKRADTHQTERTDR